jgi:hypothetical protein
MADPHAGTPWAEILTLGTAVGHTYMLVDAADTTGEEPSWAVGLNVFGLVASVGSEISRVLRRGDDEQERLAAVDVRPYVAPGRNGTEMGFAILH